MGKPSRGKTYPGGNSARRKEYAKFSKAPHALVPEGSGPLIENILPVRNGRVPPELLNAVVDGLRQLGWRARIAAFRSFSAHDQKHILASLEKKGMKIWVAVLSRAEKPRAEELKESAPERADALLRLPDSLAIMKKRSMGRGDEELDHVLSQRGRGRTKLSSHVLRILHAQPRDANGFVHYPGAKRRNQQRGSK